MPNVVPKIAEPLDQRGREARISRDSDGSPIGVALFFTSDEIEELGVDPVSSEAITMWVHDGEIYIESAD